MNQTFEEARTQIEANTVDENLTFLSHLGLHKHESLFMHLDTGKRKMPKSPFQRMSKMKASSIKAHSLGEAAFLLHSSPAKFDCM